MVADYFKFSNDLTLKQVFDYHGVAITFRTMGVFVLGVGNYAVTKSVTKIMY